MEDENKPVTIKSLKKEFDAFKAEVLSKIPEQNLKPVHGITEHIDPVNIPNEAAESMIIFHTTDKVNSIRTFTPEEHGDSWKEIANEYHRNNIGVIRKREDL